MISWRWRFLTSRVELQLIYCVKRNGRNDMPPLDVTCVSCRHTAVWWSRRNYFNYSDCKRCHQRGMFV